MALPKITQENVHLFIPLKIAKVTEMIQKQMAKIGKML